MDLVLDYFCGAGGASSGIAAAIGRSPDVAVDHWATAIDTHAANHPATLHLCTDVWAVRPRDLPAGPVGILWASPSCTHHSRARSGGTLSERLRAQPDVVVCFARMRRPKVIFVENVTEFADWGPLDDEGRPIAARKGEYFAEWVAQLRQAGYVVEWRSLAACDYGAPTTRRRLYIVARSDGRQVVWPEPTHGPGRAPYRTAASCIDWSFPCPSIFERRRPLAEATMRRIAEGLRRYVLTAARPFLVPGVVPGLVAPTLVQSGYGERKGQRPRALDLHKPLGTVVAGATKHALVAAFFVKHYSGVVGHGVERPLGTVTSRDHHGIVTASILRYNGTGIGQDLFAPLGTLTTRDRFALVTAFLRRHLGDHPIVRVNGAPHVIADVGMRMLAPRELARAQGFADDYALTGTKTDQVRQIGNAVVPAVARALVSANAPTPLAERPRERGVDGSC